MKIRVADYISNYLVEAQKITTTFILSGGGMMHLVDAIGRQEGLEYCCNHHEQVGAIAADAYARISGRLGVCYATAGPGATNTITGITGAWQDSSPVLYISGQSKLSQTIRGMQLDELRQFGTFEVDIIPMIESITKYSAFIDDAKKIRYHLEKACYLALTGRQGPVFLDIPIDIQGALIDPNELEGFTPPVESNVEKFDSKWIIEKLSTAKRPVILAGHGVRCSGKAQEFLELVELLRVPTITTSFALDLLSFNHEFYIGHPGMKGDRAGNLAVQSADLVLVIGSSLHVTTTGYEVDQFAPHAEIIFIEPDEMVHKRQEVTIDHHIRCDVAEAIGSLLAASKEITQTYKSDWHQLCLKSKNELAVSKEQRPGNTEDIDFYHIIDQLSDLSTEDDILTYDAGLAYYVIGQSFRTKLGQRIISSGSLGAMGFAFPAVTGACFAAPDKRILTVLGDGSMMTNIHELATFRKYKLNAKIFVVNNGGYSSIRNTQANFFDNFIVGCDAETGVFIPSVESLAKTFDLPYFSCKNQNQLQETLTSTLETDGPVVCEIFTPTTQQITPTVSSVKLADGSMRSRPLHDMAPFLDNEVLESYLPEGIKLERSE